MLPHMHTHPLLTQNIIQCMTHVLALGCEYSNMATHQLFTVIYHNQYHYSRGEVPSDRVQPQLCGTLFVHRLIAAILAG